MIGRLKKHIVSIAAFLGAIIGGTGIYLSNVPDSRTGEGLFFAPAYITSLLHLTGVAVCFVVLLYYITLFVIVAIVVKNLSRCNYFLMAVPIIGAFLLHVWLTKQGVREIFAGLR